MILNLIKLPFSENIYPGKHPIFLHIYFSIPVVQIFQGKSIISRFFGF